MRNRDEILVSESEINTQKDFALKIKKFYENAGKKPLALINTYGCQQNENDSERIQGMLLEMGFDFTENEEDADLILFNTCAVREGAELRVYGNLGALKHLKTRKPEVIVGVCGCMMQQESVSKKIKQKYKHVSLVFGTHSLYKFPELLYGAILGSRVFDIENSDGRIAEDIPVHYSGGPSAWVSVMYGCNNFCSYCIVPYVRGRERSRDPEQILNEIKTLSQKGVKEITLLGQNVNSYGKDLEEKIDFADLLEMAEKIDGIRRIRFMTSHPKDMSDKLIDQIAKSKKICSQIHLPFQAGSNRILSAMNRKYTKEDYLALIEKIKAKVKNASFTSDIIVGFPNETYEDFKETLDVIKKVRFDSVFSFIYSKRPGTPAAVMEDDISDEEKHRNFDELLSVQNEISKELADEHFGKIEEIMVEGPSKTDPKTLTGRTSGGKIVNFPKKEGLAPGDFIKVKITKCSTWSLMGEFYEMENSNI